MSDAPLDCLPDGICLGFCCFGLRRFPISILRWRHVEDLRKSYLTNHATGSTTIALGALARSTAWISTERTDYVRPPALAANRLSGFFLPCIVRTKCIYDLGFHACATLFASSILYWAISLALLAVTIIGTDIAPWIRILQLVAAVGFAVASAIFAIELQHHWALPAPNVLGWHIGFWDFLGSCGLALCAVFALLNDDLSQKSIRRFITSGVSLFCVVNTLDETDGLQDVGASSSAA